MTGHPRFAVSNSTPDRRHLEHHGAPQVELLFAVVDWWNSRKRQRSGLPGRQAVAPTNHSTSQEVHMNYAMKRRHAVMVLGLLLLGGGSAVEAQHWPSKPLRAIVPFAAGTLTDILPRVVFEELSTQLGQSIVVENRPGAGSTTAASLVAKADPDGYTILVNSAAHTIAPALYSSLNYDPVRDFAAVVPLGLAPSVLVVSPASGFKTVADFVAAAKAKPGVLNFGSAGVGTATHLSAIRFQSSAGVRAVHVPFKGGPEIIGEIIAGRMDFFFAPVGNALPFVKDGKLTALVVNSAKRSAALPEVPTVSESGFANAEYPFWIGMFLPSKTPRSIVDKLSAEAAKALASTKVRDKLLALGVDQMVMNPTEFDAYVEKQIAANAALVKDAGIKTH
jgi:tripartite-type tricarboxylate transporter receptor subunit TctC